MNSENTGNYRLCRHQRGVGGTIETLSMQNSEAEVLNAFCDVKKEDKWDYYCEQEVIYKDTQLDENRNLIDSAPTWIRMSV